MGFQSRLTRGWIEPFSDVIVVDLAKAGTKRLAVFCPAFVADCLETLEEIDIQLREQWQGLGGEDMLRLPCPNAHPRFVEAVAGWVRAQSR